MSNNNPSFSLFPNFPTCQKENCNYNGIDSLLLALEHINQVSVSGFIVLDFCSRRVLYRSPRICFLPFAGQVTAALQPTLTPATCSSLLQVNHAYLHFLH